MLDATGASADEPDVFSYPGCPHCSKKLSGGNCATHGPQAAPNTRHLVKLSFGDPSNSGIVATTFHDTVQKLMEAVPAQQGCITLPVDHPTAGQQTIQVRSGQV